MTTIKLSQPYSAGDRVFSAVAVAEPKWPLLKRLGEPRTWVTFPGGGVSLVENEEAIAAYLEQLVVDERGEPVPVTLLPQFGVADYMACKEALFSFFRRSSATGGSLSASESSSSGTTAGVQPT